MNAYHTSFVINKTITKERENYDYTVNNIYIDKPIIV